VHRDGPFALDLIGSVLAETDGCPVPGAGVLDLADGAVRRFDRTVVAAAGPYALLAAGEGDFDLVEWRSGARVRTVETGLGDPDSHPAGGADHRIAVAADGTVAWEDSRLAVLAPGASEPRRIHVKGIVDPLVEQVRLGGGLVAAREVAFAEGLTQVFQVSRPDGTGVRRVDGQPSAGGWAFDGARLAWATRPCAQTLIQVWDLAGAPPPPEHCVTARPARRAVRIPDTHALPVTLACPPVPAQGCHGYLEAALYKPHGRRLLTDTALQAYTLPAGTTRTVHLRILGRRRLRGLHRLVARAEFINASDLEQSAAARFAVRVG
jgi:hypothetical protein